MGGEDRNPESEEQDGGTCRWDVVHRGAADLDENAGLDNRGIKDPEGIEESAVERDRHVGGARGVDAAEDELMGERQGTMQRRQSMGGLPPR